MDVTPLLHEPKTLVLLDPTADHGESALDLLGVDDHHVSLVVLLHGPASSALHDFAAGAGIDVTTAAELYLDQVTERIARPDRLIEHVIATGPDPVFELRCLTAGASVEKVLVPGSCADWAEPNAVAPRNSAKSSCAPLLSAEFPGSAEPVDPLPFPPSRPVRTTWGWRPRPRTPQLLAATPLADRLPAAELRRLERSGTIVNVDSGATVIRRGTLGRQCVVVLDGHMEVRRGRKIVADLGAGAIAGEMSLLSGQSCNADVVTIAESELLVLNRREFATVLDSCPTMARHVLETAVSRFGATA